MDDDLKRLQKRIAGDGPAERQVLLMKLMHEFENAPKFAGSYVSDANSQEQRWIARIGALLSRVSLEHKIAFQGTRSTMVSYWMVVGEQFRQHLLAAAEEIRLELELDGHEEIGQVYEAQHQYSFLRDLKGIILGAQDEVFIVDPYLDGKAFDTYLSPVGNSCNIRLLCSKYSKDVVGHVEAFKAQYITCPEIRKGKDLHDRLVIIDGSDCWVVGGSIKDAGKKPTYLLPLQPSIAPEKILIYENIWSKSQPMN
ncbi:hypothetical protein [Ruegeria sp. HKCCD7303]|uniref:hypothetical protein n=1 Tax=Ruegeria sp. HKCCD7303 TaxID=2683013 RepID=UPI0014926762|nr:hypothetical protein [Ruegeria sp. HKCCD7303]NOD67605.1 hypothetical protein [Ruegeria sp. HKCCD7303]